MELAIGENTSHSSKRIDSWLSPAWRAQHIDRPMHACLGRLHGIVPIMDRRRWTGEIVDLVNLDIEWKRHIGAHKLEARVGSQMGNVRFAAAKSS